MSFRVLGLDDRILAAVQSAGYTEPTPIQTPPSRLSLRARPDRHSPDGHRPRRRRSRCRFCTGSRIAAFNISVVTRVLALAPTRELVVQIAENIRAYAKIFH